jgi:hypothetical protein
VTLNRSHPKKAKMPDEVQLELLAPWYTQNTSESRTLDFFDVIPKSKELIRLADFGSTV